ncbi:MAG: helix-turn-helix transcriptional regulator [Clostridia bacterium]|nr:helix-turn-helix transcriptional regulator [Clostridia bacterium]
MKLYIGETIKKLRKARDITQEEFSEILGVSCQSVSRWETGACYPDIELIPTIAAFFGISTDKLMGVDELAEQNAVRNYLQDFQTAISHGDIDACIRIARTGVAEFPNNYALLNKLMYALFVAGSDDADIPEWQENRGKYDAEIVALGERIQKYCPDIELRLEATARLAFQHCEMGRREIGRAIYESMPSMIWCRERAIWWSLSEQEKLPHLYDYIKKAYELLNDAITPLAHRLPDEQAIAVLEKLYALQDLMYDDKPLPDTWGNVNNHFRHALHCLRCGRTQQALEQLSISADAALAYDKRPEEQTLTSLLLGEVTRKRTEVDTADSRPLAIILRDSWLSHRELDPIRNTPAFQSIFARLA